MNAPTNCPADGSSIRDFWLGQVSEAANALTGTGVFSNIPAATNGSTEPIEPPKSISPSVRPDDSFNPGVYLAKSRFRSRHLAIFTCLMATSAAVITILLVTRELSTTDIRERGQSVIDVFSAAAERSKPKLIIQPSYGTSDEPAALGLAVQGSADGAVVHIEGLMPGMELSAGRPVGADAWEIPATELDYAWIAPPQGFVGTVKLIAKLRLPDNQMSDRQAIDVAWQSPISPAPVLPQVQDRAALQAFSSDPVQIHPGQDEAVSSQLLAATAGQQSGRDEVAVAPSITLAPVHLESDQHEARPASTLSQVDLNGNGTVLEPIQLIPDRNKTVAADPSAPTLQSQRDDEEIAVLLKRGKDLIATGDLAAARLMLRKAADANNAEAALALAATYDPFVLRELKVYGFTPDAATARLWYEKAIELGSPAAPRRLEMLKQGSATR
jgi:hypothetical protein